jgi:hypothetical protein
VSTVKGNILLWYDSIVNREDKLCSFVGLVLLHDIFFIVQAAEDLLCVGVPFKNHTVVFFKVVATAVFRRHWLVERKLD